MPQSQTAAPPCSSIFSREFSPGPFSSRYALKPPIRASGCCLYLRHWASSLRPSGDAKFATSFRGLLDRAWFLRRPKVASRESRPLLFSTFPARRGRRRRKSGGGGGGGKKEQAGRKKEKGKKEEGGPATLFSRNLSRVQMLTLRQIELNIQLSALCRHLSVNARGSVGSSVYLPT